MYARVWVSVDFLPAGIFCHETYACGTTKTANRATGGGDCFTMIVLVAFPFRCELLNTIQGKVLKRNAKQMNVETTNPACDIEEMKKNPATSVLHDNALHASESISHGY